MRAGETVAERVPAARRGRDERRPGHRTHGEEVVVVTGASAGVGRAVVREFARRGARIGLLARDPTRLEQTRQEVESFGGRGLAIPTDVASAEQIEAAAGAVEEELGPIDVWINNAMTTVFSPFLQTQPDEFRRVIDVLLLGYVHGTRAALSRMVPRDHGTIVQVGSALAYRGIPLQSAYCAAKHAIQGFSESVRTELLHEGSRVHLTEVDLPAMNTPQFDWSRSRMARKAQPVPPIFQPEVAARGIYWAAHHRRRALRIGLSTEMAIQGNKLLPALGDWYLGRTGYDAQQTSEPEDPGRPDNLFEPVPSDVAAHGRFDAVARRSCPQLWWTTHRALVTLASVGLVTLACLTARRASSE